MNHKREPVGQAVNSMLTTLDELAKRSLDPLTVGEVAAEQVRLGQIISRAQLILSFIDTTKPRKLWIVR